MSENFSHNKHLSAKDFQAYLRADLSEQEMHLIERHLLECEFCSEAMEGYEETITGANIREEIINLNERIDKRTKQKKKKRVFPIIRVAAIALALIVSAVFITNYFVSDIRNAEFSEKKEVVNAKEEVEEVDGEEELEEGEELEEVDGEEEEEVSAVVKEEGNGEVNGEVKKGSKWEGNGEVIKEGNEEVEELKGEGVKGEGNEGLEVIEINGELELSDADILYANSNNEEENYTQTDNSDQIVEIESSISGFSDETESSYGKSASPSEEIIIATNKADKTNKDSGRLKGIIIDNYSKEAIPFALIVVKSDDAIIAETNTDFDGKYDLSELPSAEYDIEISYVGYTKKIVVDVVVNPNKITFQNVELDTGNDLNTIEVVAYSAPLIDKDSGSSGGTVASDEINSMPMRDVSSTASKVAGVESNGKRKRLKKSKKRYSSVSFNEDEKISQESSDAYPNIGLDAFNTYLIDSLDYPLEAKEKGIKGIVIIKITVNINGEITDYKVVKSLAHGCDEEAIRLIEKGPYWIAANKKGEPISSTIKVEVTFE